MKVVFLNSFVLTGGPEGNGGSQHDMKWGGRGGGGGGGPLNFRLGCKEYFKSKLIHQCQFKTKMINNYLEYEMIALKHSQKKFLCKKISELHFFIMCTFHKCLKELLS